MYENRKWYETLFRGLVHETNKVLKDSGLVLFFIIVPLLYPLLYAYLYDREVVQEVPVVAVDESGTSLSREFLRKSDGTPDLKIISYCADFEEARELIRSHKAYGLIHVPREFSQDVADGRQATVNLYCDMSGLLYYKCLLSGCSRVSLSMNRDIKIARLGGLSEQEKAFTTMPVEYDFVAMFNPQSGFATFLIPAVLILIIQQTLVLGISLLAGTERERRAKGQEVYGEYYANPLAVLAGKTLCYLFIYTMVCVYSFWLIPKFFDLPQLWHPHDLVNFMIPLLLSCIFFAITVSFFVTERENCFLLFVFMSVPLLFMSGISWPRSNIPAFWKALSCFFPSTFGINGYVRMTNTGATLQEVKREYLWLWAHTAVYFTTALLSYIRLYRSHHMPDLKYMSQAAVELLRKRLGR